MTKDTAEKRTFEQTLAELEQVVRKLESGELALDESLAMFERGTGLARECERHLEEAKGKIEQLLKSETGELRTAAFQPRENGE